MMPSSEWILLFLIGVIVIKPEDLPALAESAGKLIKWANKSWQQIISAHGIEETHETFHKKHPFSINLPKAKIQPHKD